MSSATQLALSGSLLPVLLVGNQEEDFFLIREVLEQNQGAMPAELDHAGSIEEAKTMLQRGRYGLVLFEHDTGDAAATKLLAEFLQTGRTVPFIVLTDQADQKAVAELVQAGASDCAGETTSHRGTIFCGRSGCTLNLHSAQQQRIWRKLLAKLSCAVEQSADTIMITNSDGIIEYVNPAFEALTGYSSAEAVGQTPESSLPASKRRQSTASCGRPLVWGTSTTIFW